MKTSGAPVLWIARMRFFSHLRIRETELANRVARSVEVIALDRSESRGWEEPQLTSKLKLRWDLARGAWATWNGGDLHHFRMPVLLCTGPVLNRAAAWLNERSITEARRRFGCETVFHSDPLTFLPPEPRRRSYKFHFDLVDNFFDAWPDSIVGRSRKRFIRDAMLRADSLTAIGHCLCDRVEEFTGRRPEYSPNGAAIQEIRAWPEERTARVRARHNLEGKLALAFIGNHLAHFDGTGMLVEAFLQARKARPSLALLLVGPGSNRAPEALGVGVEQGVHSVGPVPTSEISDYFTAADVGVLPFKLETGTHHALPIKVLEFGAAGKPMLATPLDELKRLALPHVRFVDADLNSWRRALLDDASYAKPDPARLEASLLPFCWERVTNSLMKTMGLV